MSQESERLSVKQVSERTSVDQKQIRAYLRKAHARSSEQHGARWGDAKHAYALSAALTAELLARFTRPAKSA